MAAPIKVLVVSPTGKTGSSVVEGLLNSTTTKFEVTALTRESSLNNPVLQPFKDRGVKIVTADLNGPKKVLVELLTGIDVVISCIYWANLKDQIPLAEAAKEAGVKRFVPSSFQTPTPRGVMQLADWKDDVLAAIQRVHLPWTVIDVGWWSNQVMPSLPSGRTDKYVVSFLKSMPADGNVKMALSALQDIGDHVARIIVDPRTLNRKVLVYTEVMTLNQAHDLMDQVSGETSAREYTPAADITGAIAGAQEVLEKDPADPTATLTLFLNQYMNSWGVRGDNDPENAETLGYLDYTKLNPDIKGITVREIYESILDDTKESLGVSWSAH
ncbi:isoflavone reductase family protein [Pestalotiopsis sp. NC0098]|nr:isoflavone reductase family protein [Pestalotiopsis sp. NC0098]